MAGRRLIVSSAIPSTSCTTRIRGKSILLSRNLVKTLGNIILRKDILIHSQADSCSTRPLSRLPHPLALRRDASETSVDALDLAGCARTLRIRQREDPHPPFNRLSYPSASSFPSSQARFTPHRRQGQVDHRVSFHGRRSFRRLRIQRERGIHLVRSEMSLISRRTTV